MKDIATYKEELQQVEAVWNQLSSKAIVLEREVRETEQEKNRVASLLGLAKYRTLQAVLKRDNLGICSLGGELVPLPDLSYVFFTYFWERDSCGSYNNGRELYIGQLCQDHQPEIPNYLGRYCDNGSKIEIISEVFERDGRYITRIRQFDLTDLPIVKRIRPRSAYEHFGIPPGDEIRFFYPYWTTIADPINPQSYNQLEIMQKLGLYRR